MRMNTTMSHDPTTGQVHPPNLRRLAVDVIRDFWRALVPLALFEAAFKGAAFLVGAIGAAWVINPLIARTGKLAVTNNEIARYLLSPSGSLYLVLIALSLMLATLIEHVGVIAIAAAHLRGHGTTLSGTMRDLAAVFLRLLLFGLRSLATLALLCAPFVVLGVLAYLILLSRQDINYYLANRPPRWYVALGIGGLLVALLAAWMGRIYVDTIFVLPILLFGERRGRAAIEESRERAAGARLRIGGALLGWQAAGSLLGVAAVWVFGRAGSYLLAPAEARPIVLVPLVAGLLACQAVLIAALSFILVTIHCLLILHLYLEQGGTLGTWSPGEPWAIATRGMKLVDAAGPRLRRLLQRRVAIGIALLGFVGYLGFSLPSKFAVDVPIVVVAHRGCERLAPENTLSAFRKAIEVRADFAELDVQETADGVVVVLHDRDLMRIAGDPRRIADLTLAEARKVDLGRRFSPKFAGERIPTLAEVIELARGKIKLQIELKYYGKDRGLAAKVADLIHSKDFESECEVTSLDYDGLMAAKRRNPRLTVVALVTYALGRPRPAGGRWVEREHRGAQGPVDPRLAPTRQAALCLDGRRSPGHDPAH